MMRAKCLIYLFELRGVEQSITRCPKQFDTRCGGFPFGAKIGALTAE